MQRYTSKEKISRVEATDEKITGRGGLALYSSYISNVNILPILSSRFSNLRRSSKGAPIEALFKQILCWFMDKTSRHLTYFDSLNKDEAYSAAIEINSEDMASSHAVKRFFKSFSISAAWIFRQILAQLFAWRIQIENPRVIELTIDTMVMNNDEAKQRHGVLPTYKKILGFQPLQAIWNGRIVDAIFRNGAKHSNSGNAVPDMIKRLVKLIRRASPDVKLIVFRFDSGFFDEKILRLCDKLGVACIMTGKMYDTIKDHVKKENNSQDWQVYNNGHQSWEFLEFDWGCDSWEGYYRTIYTRPIYEGGQRLLEFARPDNVVISNIEYDSEILKQLSPIERMQWDDPKMIISSHHARGGDELPHRGLKDFGFETLPFKRFGPNAALYYCMLIAFFLFETFKRDVLEDIMPIGSYATTVRRNIIDVAAKIVRRGGQTIMKVTRAIMEAYSFDLLWERCKNPQAIPL